jgi:hypothetical protein
MTKPPCARSLHRALAILAPIAVTIGIGLSPEVAVAASDRSTIYVTTPEERRAAAAEARQTAEEAERAGLQALRVSNEAIERAGRRMERDMREAARFGRAAQREAHRAAAAGMAAGARGLEAGAETMALTARRLHGSHEFREQKIREAALQGRQVTHRELIELADDLQRQSIEAREDAARLRHKLDERRGQDFR